MNQATIELIARLHEKRPVKVLFVCLGNICRSPAAEGVLKQIVEEHNDSADWVIDSAGTGNYHVGDLPDHRMRVHARQRGLILDHRCRQVKELDFDRYDIIMGMDNSNLSNLRRLAPTPDAEKKIVAMSEFFGTDSRRHYDYVPDPYYEGSEGFELVLDLLQDACLNLYNDITTNNITR